MEKWQKDYLTIICNFFNNCGGYIQSNYLKELINIIFNNEYIEIKDSDINTSDFKCIEGLVNGCIECDDSDKLIKIFTFIKESCIFKK